MKEFKMTMIEAPSPGGVGACEQATVADWGALGVNTVNWMAEEKRRERREKIAGIALRGLLAQSVYWLPEKAAKEAVEHADALIAELDKPKEEQV
jgi:hypothetical protein